MTDKISRIFKAYDVRGKVPDELNPQLGYAIGRGAAKALNAKKAVIGHDARLTSPALARAICDGLGSEGVDVATVGLCGTEEIYFATARGGFDLGLMVTGSHNPADENGIKFVRAGAIPISRETGLGEISTLARSLLEQPRTATVRLPSKQQSYREEFIHWLRSYTQIGQLPGSLRVVVDCGNGCAGPVVDMLQEFLPFEVIPRHFEPDGNFPNGVPNPLLAQRRAGTAQAVLENKADLGVAFDGDFDRCFFFDASGQLVESCHLIGHIAAYLLTHCPGSTIIHDQRVYWLTRELVTAAGGRAIASRGGHSYMKEKMRAEAALYGGEMSGHHFYREFAFCDSGMLTFLLVCARLSALDQPLAEIVAEGRRKYPCSGELNFSGTGECLERIWQNYAANAVHADRIDGLNLEFPEWRFNLRSSNTEPLLRLNVETRGNPDLLAEKTAELSKAIESNGQP